MDKPNIAFIDGQNLYFGTKENNWKIDYRKFRVYLEKKYNVAEAYYYLGFIDESLQDLYDNLQRAGFIVRFKEHSSVLASQKKGNVDTDIVFEVMKNIIERKDIQKILLVSGDGDFKKMVDYLIEKQRFKKILFPNNRYASSLYKDLTTEHYDFLESVKTKIRYS